MFDIEKKIHNIRSQPEHVRVRWVWGLVIFSMMIIFLVWAISLRVNLSNSGSDGTSIKDFSQSINDSLKQEEGQASIDDLIKEGKETLEQTNEAKEVLQNLELEGSLEPGVSLDSVLDR